MRFATKGRKRLLLVPGMGLLILAIAAALVVRFVFTNGSSQFDIHALHRRDQVSAPASGIISSPGPAVTAYRNTAYKYEVALPSGWQTNDQNPRSVALLLQPRGFFVAINVYRPGDLPPAPSSLAGFRDSWLSLMRDVMPAFTVAKVERSAVGADDALVYEYTWVDRSTRLRAKALLVRGEDHSYEMFGWVPEREWPEFSGIAEVMFQSFKLDR